VKTRARPRTDLTTAIVEEYAEVLRRREAEELRRQAARLQRELEGKETR
jgi:hypothetical protein